MYLDQLVPATGDDDWVLSVGRESHTTTPVSVAVILQGEVNHERECVQEI